MSAKGFEIPMSALPPAFDEPDIPRAYYAFAQLSFAESPQLRRLLGEFEAALLPLKRAERNKSEWEEGVAEFARLEIEADRAHALAGIEQQQAALKADFEVVAQIESTMAQRNLALLQEISTLEAAHAQVIGDIAQARAELVSKDGQLVAAKRELVQTKAAAGAANRKASALEAHVEALLRSTSWRITYPMRALKLAITPSKKG